MELKYSFSELLRMLFEIHKGHGMTQLDLAKELKLSLGTINGWFNGLHKPRRQEDAERLVEILGLEPIEADLLLYSLKPTWIKYGTDPAVLATYSILRPNFQQSTISISPLSNNLYSISISKYKFLKKFIFPLMITGLLFLFIIAQLHNNIASKATVVFLTPVVEEPILITEPISITHIEKTWESVIVDSFDNNKLYWGLGRKEDPNGILVRQIREGKYNLSLTTAVTLSVFAGGDSPIFTPTTYYFSLETKKIQGKTDDGCGIFFDSVSDNFTSVYRIRDDMQTISVAGVNNNAWSMYIPRTFTQSIKPKDVNKLAILANGNDFWFFVNDVQVGKANIARVTNSRVDLSIVSGQDKTIVECEFDNLKFFTPPLVY